MKKNKKEDILEILKLVGVGVFAGAINGFFGAGGGLLIVPLFSMVCGFNSKTTHATTLGCVLFMCAASSIIYFVKNQLSWKLILVCGIGSLIGGLIGTKLLKNLKNHVIDLVFSCVLVIAGVSMILF